MKCVLALGLFACLSTLCVVSGYEIWGSDQSNSAAGAATPGIQGSFVWIWDEEDLQTVVNGGATPSPKSCVPSAATGPCNLNDLFPGTLRDAATGELRSNAGSFGRWHSVTKDPQNLYVTANLFVTGGGYIGIVDTRTKGAVGLFHLANMYFRNSDGSNTTTRSNHMSFWNHDGSAILIHNLAGKILERINVKRDDSGTITDLVYDRSATLGFGQAMRVVTEATYYVGENAYGVPLLGSITGSYFEADLGDLTPTGVCKENNCGAGPNGGRPNNVGICPIPAATNGLIFNTLGGGGLFVVDSSVTPMRIVGAYGNSALYGAGVCGEAVGEKVYFTGGVSAGAAGLNQSMWVLYSFEPSMFGSSYTAENQPAPSSSFEFPGTATGGRTQGPPTDTSGQLPGKTTRRNAHDLAGTIDGKYIHVLDTIQNVVDVFESETDTYVGTYDLTKADGVSGVGPCASASVTDGGVGFPTNDPAPDFIAPTPDEKYMLISFRGPVPVSAPHSAQGSCPGVGIVELLDGGASGKLVGVLRSTNRVSDLISTYTPPGGAPYSGTERSDVHDVCVVFGQGEIPSSASRASAPVAAIVSLIAIVFFGVRG